jgi:hypothetical protein
MMTAVAGHSNKEVMMTMVARMIRTMTQISRMCLGSSTSTEGWLMASMLTQSAIDRKEKSAWCALFLCLLSWKKTSTSQKLELLPFYLIIKVPGTRIVVAAFPRGFLL